MQKCVMDPFENEATLKRAMDGYPCANVRSPFVSIGSNASRRPHGFDSVFDEALAPRPRNAHANLGKRAPCDVRTVSLKAWLTGLVRKLEPHPLFGAVPVKIHGLRHCSRCVSLSDEGPDIARIEFVVHRYGDPVGVHYVAQVSATPPHRMYAYTRMGFVSSDVLWGIDGGDGYRFD